MPFTFRLHNNGSNANTDWFSCQPYGANVISQIVAPNGATANTEITSIPSPFARIALVKSAFDEVVKSGNLAGDTIYHKMVSDSLDVAEIFFNYEILKNKFKIIVWNIQNDLASLRQTHPQICDSLDVFLKQDAPVYHFDRMQHLYILVYVGSNRKSQMDVVGATSPASLFFTPANDLSYISNDVSFGQDHPFDGQFQPLHNRDPKFVEYLFTFRANYGQSFPADFPEVDKYLDATFSQLPPDLQQTVANIPPNAIEKFNSLTAGSNTVDILGKPWHTKPLQPVKNSAFTIAGSFYTGSVLPLVLPVEKGNTYSGLFYVTDNWGTQNAAPYSDSTPWQNRKLPFDATPHPYLTIGDFLEDTILAYPGSANTQGFFFGNFDHTSQKSILLPLKPLFFEFFTVDQLINGINGTPMLQISQINKEDISVNLTIPIAGGTISYTKNYYSNAKPESSRNRGAVKFVTDTNFGLAMLPMIQTGNPYYRIAILHDFNDNRRYHIECYEKGQRVDSLQQTVRNKTDKTYPKTLVYSCDSDQIDCVQVCIGADSGLAIPRFNNLQRNLSYTFAVDFGTTNTYIEYTDGQDSPAPFKDKQLAFWSEFDATVEQTLEADLVTVEIGDKFAFPTRTALSEASDTDWKQQVIPMAQTNIPLVYGHRPTYRYNKVTTDLKWSNDTENVCRVKSYIENLMILMRNKVLHEGGVLDNTRIIWFYPGSMTIARRTIYQSVWNDAYRKYFGGPAANICSTLESIAPYKYFSQQNGAASRMVSIDIGGGTTDIVITDGGRILYTTSFRFAANSIFGDGYTQGGALNGLVDYFIDEILATLNANNLSDLQNVLMSLRNTGRSDELASFFFSLRNDDKVKEKKVSDNLDWNRLLQQDNKFKVVFLLFYAAIIYHIAHIMHAKKLNPPRHIAFSGNGAKVISVLSPDVKILAGYAKDIFCRIYGLEKYDSNGLDIILTGEPKAATCKGGINMMQAGNVGGIDAGEKLVLKVSENFFDPQVETYQSIDDKLKKDVVDEVEKFLEFTLKSNPSFSVDENFGIKQTLLDSCIEVCNKDLDTFLQNGINISLNENAPSTPVAETLFFYPIIGMLHELCNHINTNANVNN